VKERKIGRGEGEAGKGGYAERSEPSKSLRLLKRGNHQPDQRTAEMTILLNELKNVPRRYRKKKKGKNLEGKSLPGLSLF